MTLGNADIIALFTNIAVTHPSIAHGTGNSPVPNRFWGFDGNELVSGTTSSLNFGAQLLGLSSNKKGDINWDYRNTGSTTSKLKYIPVHIIQTYKENDFADQETKAQACEQTAEDIILWLNQVARGMNQDAWPVVQLMDLKSVSVKRVNNIGIANCTGCIITITLRDNANYSNSNPLNSMTP